MHARGLLIVVGLAALYLAPPALLASRNQPRAHLFKGDASMAWAQALVVSAAPPVGITLPEVVIVGTEPGICARQTSSVSTPAKRRAL